MRRTEAIRRTNRTERVVIENDNTEHIEFAAQQMFRCMHRNNAEKMY